jgi:hypothetical protein
MVGVPDRRRVDAMAGLMKPPSANARPIPSGGFQGSGKWVEGALRRVAGTHLEAIFSVDESQHSPAAQVLFGGYRICTVSPQIKRA